MAAEGQPGRELEDDYDCDGEPGGRELQRDAVHAALRQPRQEHHQQPHRQRGRQCQAYSRA